MVVDFRTLVTRVLGVGGGVMIINIFPLVAVKLR